MKPKSHFLPSAVAIALSQMIISPASGAVLTVNSLADDLTGANGLCTLREAIVSVNDSTLNADCGAVAPGALDQIVFGPSISEYDTISLTSGQLLITSDVSIVGPTGGGYLTIEQDGTDRVLTIEPRYNGPSDIGPPPVVSIDRLTIAGGSMETGGGGIRMSFGAELTLSNSAVTGNQSQSFGGGIAVEYDSTLTLQNSVVAYNQAGSYGGGIDVYYDSTLIARASTISANSAASYGGGVSVVSGVASFDLGTHVDYNDAGMGGGIATSNSEITFSTYAHVGQSEAAISGGCAYAVVSQLELKQSAYLFNCSAGQTGGGIFSNYSEVSIVDSLIIGSVAVTGNGGGIEARGSFSSIHLDRATVYNNQAGGAGGGVYLADGNATIKNTNITYNISADKGGGVMVNNGGTLMLENATIAINSASGNGGGLNLYQGVGTTSASITNTLVSGNFSGGTGIEVAAENGPTITVDGVNLFGNSNNTGAASLLGFTPGVNDINATSDGGTPFAFGEILESVEQNTGVQFHFPLAVGSPALGAADANLCSDLDQVKFDRGLTFFVPIKTANGNIATVNLGGSDCSIGSYDQVFEDLPPPPRTTSKPLAQKLKSDHKHKGHVKFASKK